MESGKQGITSPETSSEENNIAVRSGQANGDTSERADRSRRSYECTYCKRGFTNAQALGGHMNIHRKDRAKAKQNSNANIPPATNITTSDSPFSSHSPAWYESSYNINRVDHQSNYYHHHNSSGPSIAAPFPFGYSSNFESLNHSLAVNDELMRADLSLQIDSSRYFDRHDDVNDELDLELRLGHR